MALAFVNSRPFVTSNIIGASTMEQLKADIASAGIRVDDTLPPSSTRFIAAIQAPFRTRDDSVAAESPSYRFFAAPAGEYNRPARWALVAAILSG